MPSFYRMDAQMIFFNFYELEIIRRNITEDLESFYNDKTKRLVFATSARVYSYLNQIVSVRIILAKFSPIPEEDIPSNEIEIYKKTKEVDPNKLVEEEKDSDEEDEEEVQNAQSPDGEKGTTITPDLNQTQKPQDTQTITIEKK